jgi:hypothetical protein
MMMYKIRSDTEEPRTGVWATEVIGPSGTERRGEGLADEVLGIKSANPLQDVPLQRPSVPVEKGCERIGIGERSLDLLGIR